MLLFAQRNPLTTRKQQPQGARQCPFNRGSWIGTHELRAGSSSARQTPWRSPAPVAASTPHAALRSAWRATSSSRAMCVLTSCAASSATVPMPSAHRADLETPTSLPGSVRPPVPLCFSLGCAIGRFLGRMDGDSDGGAATRYVWCLSAAQQSN